MDPVQSHCNGMRYVMRLVSHQYIEAEITDSWQRAVYPPPSSASLLTDSYIAIYRQQHMTRLANSGHGPGAKSLQWNAIRHAAGQSSVH